MTGTRTRPRPRRGTDVGTGSGAAPDGRGATSAAAPGTVAFEQPHDALGPAVRSLGSCVCRSAALIARGRVHQPRDHVGQRCAFADGTSAAVYRETVVDRPPPRSPAVLVVRFELRGLHAPRLHSLFRLESELHTPLFIGFPGFVSKLWIRQDEHGCYRGLYDWDDPSLATRYVGALWWALRVVSVPDSIQAMVFPGLRRDDLLADPHLADAAGPEEPDAWWRLAGVDAPA
jgi:hypothetical protein